MDRWIYTNENVHITPKFLREALTVVESELVKIFFLELNLNYDYEIEIQHFSNSSVKLSNYWIRLKFFLNYNKNKKFTLMTLYCADEINYPVKIQVNYLYDDFLEIKNESDFLEMLKKIFKKCFLEMNSYIEYNSNKDDLLGYNKDEDTYLNERERTNRPRVCASKIPPIEYFSYDDKQLVKKNTNKSVNRKKWTREEKEIIIDNISSYRKKIYNNDKELVKRITDEFASNLLSKYNDIFKSRSVNSLANRLAYFDELLAGVNTNYAKTDEIYFEKLKRLDGNSIENPARKWRG